MENRIIIRAEYDGVPLMGEYWQERLALLMKLNTPVIPVPDSLQLMAGTSLVFRYRVPLPELERMLMSLFHDIMALTPFMDDVQEYVDQCLRFQHEFDYECARLDECRRNERRELRAAFKSGLITQRTYQESLRRVDGDVAEGRRNFNVEWRDALRAKEMEFCEHLSEMVFDLRCLGPDKSDQKTLLIWY